MPHLEFVVAGPPVSHQTRDKKKLQAWKTVISSKSLNDAMDIEQRIREIAQKYQAEGYAVVLRPQGEAVPDFAKDYALDMVARKGEENVIVEVALNRNDLAKKAHWQRLAELTNAVPGWRFDLVVLEPVTQIDRAVFDAREPSDPEIGMMLVRAERMLHAGDLESACVSAWAALEASMRRARDEAELEGGTAPSEIISTLYSNGFLDRQEFETLRTSFRIRTQIVHGLVHAPIDPAMIHSIIAIARKLISAGQEAEAVSGS